MNDEHASKWPRRYILAGAVAIVAAATIIAACGGGSDSKDKTATKASGTATSKPATTGTNASGTPGADGSTANGTPGAVNGTVAAANGTPVLDANGTPIPAATPGAGDTPVAGSTPIPGTGDSGPDPVSEAEATLAAETDPDIAGGDPTKPQEVVGNVPDPPASATIDSRTIADPNPSDNNLQVLIDLDASKAGIQDTRDVKVGDVIRVGIVVVNADPIVAVGLDLNYDHSKVIAPTIINGSSTDRNPDLNIGALGGVDAGWICSPSPIGDRDDDNAADGDGNPATGQAVLNCYTPANAPGPAGTVVVATVEFRVTASGSADFSLSNLSLFNDDAIAQFGRCDGDDGAGPPIPCHTATLNIQ